MTRRKPTSPHERGALSNYVVVIAIALVAVTGLVVDGAGKIQAATDAQHVAASAARAATNQLDGSVIDGGSIRLDPYAARTAAEDYIAAAGMAGTATVRNGEITVTVQATYPTRFLSIIGIDTLTADGYATAQLITGPEGAQP